MRNYFINLFTIILLCSNNAWSFSIESEVATYEDKKFNIDISGSVSAPSEEIFFILSDYNNLSIISPKIIESKIIRQEDGKKIVRSVIKDCVLFFCQEVINTQITAEYKENTSMKIYSKTLPEESNLKSGVIKWTLTEDGNKTKIDYHAEAEPEFKVPKIIGQFFVKYYISKEAKNLIENIENLANKKMVDKVVNN